MKLLLFDIDGTILRVVASGRQILSDALGNLLQRPIVTDGVRFSGRTDQPILREILVNSGYDPDEAAHLLPSVIDAYRLEGMRVLENGGVRLLPGVADLLETLFNRDDVVLGLLTGNIEDMAWAKLRAANVDRYFSFGAFGSDHEDRYQLTPVAVARAREHTGILFDGPNVVIIGDTEHDVMCGREHGVFSVAVATGHFDREYLSGFHPDLLLDDLSDLNAFVNGVI